MDCLFCKFIRKEIPCAVIYEDDAVLAFLDIHPIHAGHTLVLPKEHATSTLENSDAALSAVSSALKKVVPAVLKATGATGWNLGVNSGADAGQAIMHTHWHVIPRFNGDGLEHWPKIPYSAEELAKMAEKVRASY